MPVIDQVVTPSYALYHGDCVEVMRDLPDASVDYSIFSPPFASLYTYSDSDRDLGNSRNYEEFFEHFAYVVEQLTRLIKPGRLVSMHCMLLPTNKQSDGYTGLRDFRGDLIKAMVSHGWIMHSEVCIWKDPVTAMQRTHAIGLLHKQVRKDSAMSRQGVPDYVVTFRDRRVNAEPITHVDDGQGYDESKPLSRASLAYKRNGTPIVWQRYASPIWTDIDPSDTLQYRSAREDEDERHICPLQLEVIRRCVRLWSNPKDAVLSPFAGIGSEGYVAIEMGRRFVGAELKESYYKQAALNLDAAGRQLSLIGGEG